MSVHFKTTSWLDKTTRLPTMVVMTEEGTLLPLTDKTHKGKPIVRFFGKYEGDQVVPAEPMDNGFLRRAEILMPTRKVRISLDESPPKTGPTLVADVSDTVIGDDEKDWRPVQMVVEFVAPEGDFSFKVRDYTIEKCAGKFRIIY
jgi:hypothetical protein